MILYTLYFILFVFGLCVGSFLNAVIFRLKNNESALKGRSYCPHCRHVLNWRDLAPVFSFIFLRGKCRYCGKKISWQYPLVEILTGILFVLIFIKTSNFQLLTSNLIPNSQFPIPNHQLLVIDYQLLISLIYFFYIVSVLIIIFAYDLKHYIIPDKILFPAIGISIMYHVLSIIQNHTLYFILHTLYNYFGSAAGASLFFFSLVAVSRGRAMGLGDVKLAFLMGLVLGWPDILVALFLAFALGAAVGLSLILIARHKFFTKILISRESFSRGERFSKNWGFKSQIPFGPFLVMGTFVAFFWGEKLINWYLNIFI